MCNRTVASIAPSRGSPCNGMRNGPEDERRFRHRESTFHSTGMRFENGYESEGLAHILEFVMQRQNSFALPVNLGRQGLLQISTPTVEQSVAAAARINEFCGPLTSTFAKPTVA